MSKKDSLNSEILKPVFMEALNFTVIIPSSVIPTIEADKFCFYTNTISGMIGGLYGTLGFFIT